MLPALALVLGLAVAGCGRAEPELDAYHDPVAARNALRGINLLAGELTDEQVEQVRPVVERLREHPDSYVAVEAGYTARALDQRRPELPPEGF